MVASLSAWDWVTVVASFVAVFGIAIWGGLRKVSGSSGAADFFLAGRNMSWWIIGGSLFASNIGTEHFVGQAGTAASSGIAVGMYEWTAAYMILALGWIFAPVYLRCQLTTIPELLEKRFNKHCRLFFVVISLLAYIMAKISASLFAGVIILETVVGWNAWQSLPAILFLTALYTITGGLTTVMLTDTVQMFIFIIGGVTGSIISLNLVGGISGLFSTLNEAGLTDFEHLLRPTKDSHFPWPGMLFGIPVVSIWYWCVDQEMAQRVLSAPDIAEARLGTGFAGMLKIIPVFITVFPGMVARCLYQLCLEGNQRFSSWCSTDLSDHHTADRAYPLLVLREFPQGVKGLMVASFLAAMMSSLASVLNSASTVFTFDVYTHIRGSRSLEERELVLVGRIATAAMTILAFCWLPVISLQASGLYVCTQTAMTHLAPPVSALYICGLFIRRTNGKGAFLGVLAGSMLGLCRLSVYLVHSKECTKYVVDGNIMLTASNWFVCINFNYFALILFGFTALMIVILSFFFPPPSHSQTKETMVQWTWPLRKHTPTEEPEKAALIDSEICADPEDEGQMFPSGEKNGEQKLMRGTKHVIAGGVAIAVLVAITSLVVYFH